MKQTLAQLMKKTPVNVVFDSGNDSTIISIRRERKGSRDVIVEYTWHGQTITGIFSADVQVTT